MKALNGQNGDANQQSSPTSNVETYWVVDVFGQNDKVKRKSRRPPSYNPEDYVVFFRKVLGSTNANGSSSGPVDKLYGKDSHMSAELKSKGSSSNASSSSSPEDLRGNNKQSSSLSDVSEILKKLRQDLCFSFVSFCKEFAAEPCDGISILMELLRTIQMAQTELNGSNKELSQVRANRRSLIRAACADELEVLLCLYQLCLANGHVPGRDQGCARLLAHTPGFYGLALALVSNLTRTRSLALQMMTALCRMPGGHSRVSEALTTLRLNMGESVRLKLLSGIINSTASRVESLSEAQHLNRNAPTSSPSENNGTATTDPTSTSGSSVEPSLRFLVEAMAFLNAFVQSAADLRSQVVIQWEVEEASLNIHALSQVADTTRNPLAIQLKQELALWTENQINISLLIDRLSNVTSTNEALRKDLLHLRSRLQDLESEKKRFSDFEGDMKKRCQDLEKELVQCRSRQQSETTSSSTSIGIQTGSMETGDKLDNERFPLNKDTLSKSQMSFDDEEYSIDDVLEELNNIVNSAESDMNTESSLSAPSSSPSAKGSAGGSFTEEFVVSSFIPRPPLRPIVNEKRTTNGKNISKTTSGPMTKVQLDSDLCGETSDFVPIPLDDDMDDEVLRSVSPSASGGSSDIGPTEISRKKITRTFFGGQTSDMEDDEDDDALFDNVDNQSFDEDEGNRRTTSGKRRNKVTRKSVRSDGATTKEEGKIQPDILRTIPTRLFHKSWDVLEARSPMYVADDMGPLNRRHPPLREPSGGSQHSIEREEMIVAAMTAAGTTGRRRHLSVDNLSTIQRDGPIFVHPTVHHPSAAVHGRDHSMDEMLLRRAEQQQQRFLMEIPQPQMFRQHFSPEPEQLASRLGDLQVGDVFTFPSGHQQLQYGNKTMGERPSSRKSKRDSSESSSNGSQHNNKPANTKQPFALSNLLPAWLKSGGSKSESSSKTARDEWESFHTPDKSLMKDYRQHFQHPPALSVAPPPPIRHPNDLMMEMMSGGPPPAEFWPPSFQAMPFRNIPPMYHHHHGNGGDIPFNLNAGRPDAMQQQQPHGRPVPLPSPTQLARGMQMHLNRMSKLMDHPSGLY